MDVIDLKLIEAYTILVLAEVKTIDEIPLKYRNEVNIRVAEETIRILDGEDNGL